VILELEGEQVKKATPVLGYLHRGIEKLGEAKNYHKFIPLTDRLDYAGCFVNNYGYVLAVEKLLGIEVPPRAKWLRVVLAELTRLSSHLLWLGTHAMDIGAATVFLYSFREKEHTYDLFEKASGQRMTTSYARIGGLAQDVPDGWVADCRAWAEQMPRCIDEYETLLTHNRIWLQRTVGVGVLTREQVLGLGLCGPMLRGSGVQFDVRKAEPYGGYDELDFEVPVGTNGDTYDRYLVRLAEMRQSLRIIHQALDRLEPGDVLGNYPKIVPPPHWDVPRKMESLIHHFKLITEGFRPPVGEVYMGTEASKGELGFTLVSDGTEKPYRIKIRVPSFANLQSLPVMAKDRMVADMSALIGTVDICLADVDK
jgi:NADH-quinone oxidoreductase subunit D